MFYRKPSLVLMGWAFSFSLLATTTQTLRLEGVVPEKVEVGMAPGSSSSKGASLAVAALKNDEGSLTIGNFAALPVGATNGFTMTAVSANNWQLADPDGKERSKPYSLVWSDKDETKTSSDGPVELVNQTKNKRQQPFSVKDSALSIKLPENSNSGNSALSDTITLLFQSK